MSTQTTIKKTLGLIFGAMLIAPLAIEAVSHQLIAPPSGNQPSAIQTTDSSDNGGDQSLNFSSGDFGWNGPLSLNANYSNVYGFYFTGKYAQAINKYNAFNIEADYGDRQWRVNATYGLAFTTRQRIKLSAERLAQKMDFSFAAGDDREKIGQYAGGLTYQYLFPSHIDEMN